MKLFRVEYREGISCIWKTRYIVASSKLKVIDYLRTFCVFDNLKEVKLSNNSVFEFLGGDLKCL